MKIGMQLCVLLLMFSGTLFAQTDSLQANRYVTRATMYGVGYANVLDTYLSPQEYTGIEFRISRETMQMTRLFDGNVSVQNYFQTNVSYTSNRAETNNTFSGLVNWSYGLHYQFRVTDKLKFLAGALGEVNGGFVYNLRNSNNPASAKAYFDLSASGMMIYHFKIKRYPLTLRYQANLPLAGVMFSPDHLQTYYEIFSLGNSDNVVKFTSVHNHLSLRQMVSLDFPIKYAKLRVSYLVDLQQSELNGLKTHNYSNVFMIGLVKNLFQIKNKSGEPLPPSLRAY